MLAVHGKSSEFRAILWLISAGLDHIRIGQGRRLFEVAQALLTRTIKCSWLKAWGMKIAKRRGMKRAIVAVARRMAVVMHRMWVNGTNFQWTREEAAAA